jgi:hypothetical protein
VSAILNLDRKFKAYSRILCALVACSTVTANAFVFDGYDLASTEMDFGGYAEGTRRYTNHLKFGQIHSVDAEGTRRLAGHLKFGRIRSVDTESTRRFVSHLKFGLIDYVDAEGTRRVRRLAGHSRYYVDAELSVTWNSGESIPQTPRARGV